MKVYQIHLNFNSCADDAQFYYGYDHRTLYTNRETAESKAEEILKEYKEYDDTVEDYTIVKLEVV